MINLAKDSKLHPNRPAPGTRKIADSLCCQRFFLCFLQKRGTFIPMLAQDFDSYFEEPVVKFRVKEVCEEQGVSLSQLAVSVGMTLSNLKRLLEGNPTVNSLEKVANALHVGVPDLIDEY